MTRSDSYLHSVPNEKQYAYLRALNVGAIICGSKRETEMYLRRGWVTAEFRENERHYPYVWIRITPDGLRALAAAVEKYELPPIGPRPKKWQHFCGKCDSTYILGRPVDVEIPLPTRVKHTSGVRDQ